MKSNTSSSYYRGFTIVELLVVVVVIGVLAAITIVSYANVTQRAKIASLQSDLSNNSRKLSLYYTDHGFYPTALDPVTHCPTAPVADSGYCLTSSPDTALSYQPSSTTNATQFSLYASSDTTFLRLSSDTGLTASPVTKACPYGFIVVPGSTTYGTSDFCVMKYEAKRVGSTTTPISQASGIPWVNVPQELTGVNNDAKEYSQNVEDCTGCHLITEAEWLTIAQNVLSVPSNWSGGAVGSGYIYIGHSDNVPANSLEASTNDSDGYYLTGQTTGNQRRTLTLTNGEVIWDMSGNVWDYTSGTVQSPTVQPGIDGAGFVSREWDAVTTIGTLPVNPYPSYATPAASAWNSANGIGFIISNSDETALMGFFRGGQWWGAAGVFSLRMGFSPDWYGGGVGFRVSQ